MSRPSSSAAPGDGGTAIVETTCHATCLVLGEDGVLLRGPSGSGKSSLCLALLDQAGRDGGHARLVGDDRVRLHASHRRLIGRPHPALTGRIEIRGLGIRRLSHAAEATVIRLVVDLVAALPRMPEEGSGTVTILGVALPLLLLEPRQPREYLIRQRLLALRPSRMPGVTSPSHPAALSPDRPRDV